MKILFLLFVGFIVPLIKVNGQSKVIKCEHYIYVDAIGRGMRLNVSGDTLRRPESELYYLRLFVKSCNGAMYIERRLVSGDKLVFAGFYQDAIKLDSVHGIAIDPITGNKRTIISTQYRPLRTGKWKFYNETNGLLAKEEEYKDGKLIKK